MKLTIHLHQASKPKNAWSYTSTPQYAFMTWCSVLLKKHRDDFSLPFTLPGIN